MSNFYQNKLARIAVHKSLLKEYSNSSEDRIVYMNNGTEFQIEIFNPYDYTIGVSFCFNENFQGNSHLLVVRPGERIWLDRYLDDESRLLFSTYSVEDSKQAKDAIKNNGRIVIKFFKEQQMDSSKTWWYNNNITTAVYDTANYNTATSGLMASSITSANTSANYNLTSFGNTIDTGRIEKGSHSNVKFQNVWKDFEYLPFKTEHIKILPNTRKPIYSNDLKKKYCHNCGRKLNEKFKYCPYCGTKQ